MNNAFVTARKTGRLTCAWVPAVGPNKPLVCIWSYREPSTAASPTDEVGRLLLCA